MGRLMVEWSFSPAGRSAGRIVALLAGLAAARAPAADSPPKRQAVEFFEKKIRPVLADHCYKCHSADAAKSKKLKAGLFLDTRAGMLKGGDTGPALVPGKPDESLLVQALRCGDDL